MIDPFTFMAIASAGTTLIGGVSSARQQAEAGRAERMAQIFEANERWAQVGVIKRQSKEEELERRRMTLMLKSNNVASAAASGALSTSAMFENIEKVDADRGADDIRVIRYNSAQGAGQAARQADQHLKAGVEAEKQGRARARTTLFNTGTDLLMNAPIGVTGRTD